MSEFSSERRTIGRVELISQAQCVKRQIERKTIDYDPVLEVTLLNVSENGLCIKTAELFKKDEFITLNILLEDEIYMGVRGKVLWVMKDGESHQYGLLVENMSGRLVSHSYRLDNRTESRI